MSTARSVVCVMSLKDTIATLTEGKSLYSLSKAYGIAKDGAAPERGDQYSSAIKRMIEDPDAAKWESLRPLLAALGVDAETAIAIAAASRMGIAASQVKPKEGE